MFTSHQWRHMLYSTSPTHCILCTYCNTVHLITVYIVVPKPENQYHLFAIESNLFVLFFDIARNKCGIAVCETNIVTKYRIHKHMMTMKKNTFYCFFCLSQTIFNGVIAFACVSIYHHYDHKPNFYFVHFVDFQLISSRVQLLLSPSIWRFTTGL